MPAKHDDDTMVSCISAPSIVGTQLERLGSAGDKVFEADAATGCNLALLAGPAGHVWVCRR